MTNKLLVERVAMAIIKADEENGYDYNILQDNPEISDWSIHLALAAIRACESYKELELWDLPNQHKHSLPIVENKIEQFASLDPDGGFYSNLGIKITDPTKTLGVKEDSDR